MVKRSPDVDAYIQKSAPFAQPILKKLRQLFHQGCPELEEKLKWGMPSFEYKGLMGGMAGFKKHVTAGFWKQKLIPDKHGFLHNENVSGLGSKIYSLKDLPPDSVFLDYVRHAVRLNEEGVKISPSGPRKPAKRLTVPADLKAALQRSPKAKATFVAFSPSHCNEYVQWITEAKREETRQKRLKTTIEWLSKGKPRNWKYMDC